MWFGFANTGGICISADVFEFVVTVFVGAFAFEASDTATGLDTSLFGACYLTVGTSALVASVSGREGSAIFVGLSVVCAAFAG